MQIWEKFLQKQEEKLGKEIVQQWLRSLKIVQFDAANLYLEATNSFQIHWFEEHIRPKIAGTFRNENGRPIKIHLTFEQESEKTKKDKKKFLSPSPPLQFYPDALDHFPKMENFTFGQTNGFIQQFFQNFSLGAFNPILVHGETGVGKTHLLQACAKMLAAKGYKVFFIHSETFSEHVITAMRYFQMQEFRSIYRHQDVLIMDDIHLLARKMATQEEFFHTFNALHAKGAQILLSSSMAPIKLSEIEPRLISRFEWGITFHLQKLSDSERSLLLRMRSEAMKFSLNQEVEDFLIHSLAHHPKLLVKALDTLILSTLQTQETLEIDQVKELLADLIKSQKELLSPEKILSTVANYFGILKEDILGKAQTQECAFPRQIAMFLCRKLLRMPYLKIGKIFSRDHSTVMSSIRQVEKKIEMNHPITVTVISEVETKYAVSALKN